MLLTCRRPDPAVPTLRWTLRRVFAAGGYENFSRQTQFYCRLRETKSRFNEFLGPLDRSMEMLGFGRSEHAARRARGSLDPDEIEKCDEDFWCGTAAVFFWLLFFTHHRRSHEMKWHANASLVAVLQATVERDTAEQLLVDLRNEDVCGLCAEAVDDAATVCRHMAAVGGPRPDGIGLHAWLASALRSASEVHESCSAAAAWLVAAVEQMSLEAEVRVDEWGDVELEKCQALVEAPEAHKRRRVEPLLKRRVCQELAQQGRNVTDKRTMRALVGDHDAEDGTRWRRQELRYVQAAQWLTCHDMDAVGFSVDGVAVGCPKRDVLLSLMCVPKTQYMMLGMPVTL